jgi:hypothetical protein
MMSASSISRRMLVVALAAPLAIVVAGNRSLWLDEAALGYNIVSRSYAQLLGPLAYVQVAPIGFLLFSKLCNSLFGHNDIAIRVPSMVAYVALFVILARRARRSPAGVLRFVLIAGAAGVIKYAFDLKPYIYDVLLMVLLLDQGSALLSGNRRAALFSTVSVLFSSASFMQLPLFALLDGVRHRRPAGTAFLRILAVSVPLAVYYFLFAYRHPAEGRMAQFWSKGFLFSSQGSPVAFVVHRLLGVIHTGYFSAAFQLLWIFYFIGLYRYIKTRDYAALAATQLPVVAHLTFSALQLYPFDGGRLTLYLLVPFVYCAADGLRVAIAALARWRVPVIGHDAGSSFEVATILAVVGNALGYALLAPKREDLRPVLAELRRRPDWYKRSVPLHFLPSSGKQLDYYAAQSRAAGKPFLEGYRTISRDQGWDPFLRDVLRSRRVVLVFSHSGRFFRHETGRQGYLATVNRKLADLHPSPQHGLRVSRFVWANRAGLFEVEHAITAP